MKTIKQVFDEHFNKIKFNKELYKEVYQFKMGFISKTEESIEFFGGNLIGVHVVKFTPADENRYLNLFDLDSSALTELVNQMDGVNKSFNVAGNPFNVVSPYLIHRFITSSYLGDKDKLGASTDVAMIMNIRFLTGLMNYYFRYPIDKETSEAIYAGLSFKYAIKQAGSWGTLLENRSKDSVEKDSIHYKTLSLMKDDAGVAYFITDSQGRLRDMMKNLYREFKQVKDDGSRISKKSSVDVGLDGVESFKDSIAGLAAYNKYLYNILPDRNSFIRSELINVVADLVPSLQEKQLVSLLEWLSLNYMDAKYSYVTRLLDLSLVYSFNYTLSKVNILHNPQDLGYFLTTLRGGYLSSKSREEDLLELRELGDKVVKDSLKIKSKATVTTLRLSLFLYVCLRVYTKHHYS